MPESKGRKKKVAHRDEVTSRQAAKPKPTGNPPWFVPVMLGLMILGLLWIVTFYITSQRFPVPQWGRWNLGAGFALMMAGFLMTTRWR
ncbi:cell division protein CrgA [Actinomycetota bacterium]